MDPTTLRWLAGIVLVVIFGLIGIIYWQLRAEDQRLAKNIHDLRGFVARISLYVERIKERLKISDD